MIRSDFYFLLLLFLIFLVRMTEHWKKRTYPITFQLCTGSKLDRVELYGNFENGDWSKPIAQLQSVSLITTGNE